MKTRKLQGKGQDKTITRLQDKTVLHIRQNNTRRLKRHGAAQQNITQDKTAQHNERKNMTTQDNTNQAKITIQDDT